MKQFEVCRVDSTHELINDEEVTPHGVEEPIVHLFGYDQAGDWHHEKVRGFEPYCYVRWEQRETAADISGVKRIVTTDEDGEPFTTVREERVVKVVTQTTGDVSDVHSEFDTTWESDVLFPNRFVADMDLGSGVQILDSEGEYTHISMVQSTQYHADWRVHVVDIEVDDRNGFPENGREPIVCITAFDSFNDEYIVWLWHDDYDEPEDLPSESEMHDADVTVKWCDSERKMLLSYLGHLQGTKPGVITAWNVGFDLPYIWDRSEHLNEHATESEPHVPYKRMSPLGEVQDHDYFGTKTRGIATFDLLEGFKSTQYTDMDSYRLEDVAQEYIGVGKETYVGTVGDLWDDDPKTLVEYNLKDVELCVELDRRQEIIPFWKAVGRIGTCQLEETTVESSVVDKYLLNDLHGEAVLPRQGSQENVSGSYSGGAVFDAVNGLYQNVPTLDLASLYPMSMLTLNISPETKVDPDEYDGDTFVSPNGIHFRKDKDGITKEVIEYLYDERTDLKDERDEHDAETERYDVLDRQQAAVKVIMNSLYGVLAWNRFRLYDPDGARATTATGREVLAFTSDMAEEMGHEVLYGDTDSVLLNFPDAWDTEKCIEEAFEVEEFVNDRYSEFARDELNAEEHHFDIEFEKLYSRFFQSGAKKRYAGHIEWSEGQYVEKQDITGYEYRRSDASPLANEVQEKVLRMICTGEDPKEVGAYVHEQIQRVMKRKVTLAEIGIPEGIGKDMDDYQSATHSVRAGKLGNLLLGTTFTRGTNPRRYYLEGMDRQFWTDLEEDWVDVERDPLYNSAREDGYPRYIAVEDAEELPGECQIDWGIHKKKCLKQTLSSITSALGLEWDELEKSSQQTGLDSFASA